MQSTLPKTNQSLRRLPLFTALAVLVATWPFAWSKDFAVFLFALFYYAPTLLLASITLAAIAVMNRRSPTIWRPVLASLTIVLALPLAIFFATPAVKDRVRFLLWYATHQEMVERAAERDAILADWEGWGMAGMENDSYLVSNPDGSLDAASTAQTWPRRVGSDCEPVAIKRMAHAIYIVTTSNCPLR